MNTSGYHPQTNGFVEKFNSTLTPRLPKIQAEIGTSTYPFFCLPIRLLFMTQQKRVHFIGCMAEIPGYHQRLSFVNRHPTLLTDCLTTAWGLAKEYIKGAQNKQNKSMTRGPRITSSRETGLIHMPAAVTGKAWKLARPYHGLYRVLSVTPTNILLMMWMQNLFLLRLTEFGLVVLNFWIHLGLGDINLGRRRNKITGGVV